MNEPDALESLKLWRHDGPQRGAALDALLDTAISAWELERRKAKSLEGDLSAYAIELGRRLRVLSAVSEVRRQMDNRPEYCDLYYMDAIDRALETP